MEKAIIIGLGPEFIKCEEKLRREYDITGIISNDPQTWGKVYNGIPVGSFDIVNRCAYDFVLLSSMNYQQMLLSMLNANFQSRMKFLAITPPYVPLI